MICLGRVMFVRMDERLTPEAFERYLTELGGALDARREGHLLGIVYDLPAAPPLDAVRRRRVADLLVTRQGSIEKAVVAVALASPSKAARGVIEAIHWMAPPVYAHAAVGTLPEALAFLGRFLREIDPEAYAVEYQRRVLAHGASALSVRPPPSSGPASTRRTGKPPSGKAAHSRLPTPRLER